MSDGLRQGRNNKQLVYYDLDLTAPSQGRSTLVAVFLHEHDAARYAELFNDAAREQKEDICRTPPSSTRPAETPQPSTG